MIVNIFPHEYISHFLSNSLASYIVMHLFIGEYHVHVNVSYAFVHS